MSTTIPRYNEKSFILDSRRTFSEDQEEENEKRTSLPLASFNFINSIIGSGVIGIPYALHESGFGFGVLLLLLVAYVTDYSLILMVRSGHISGRFTYQGIMESAFGKPGHVLLGLMQFIYPFIAMVSYNVVVGDTVTKVAIRLFGMSHDSLFAKRQIIVLVCTLFVTVPLCLYRNIAKLANISFLSLVCIAFILLSIFIRMGSMQAKLTMPDHAWSFMNADIIPAIGIMSFAFMCHHNTFLIYGSIKEASEEKWKIVTHASIFTSFLVTILFGIAGYATFTTSTQGDLLENYCWDDDLMNFSRLLFSVTILLTYPIECFVVRDVIEYSFLRKDSEALTSDKIHYGITITIIALTYLLSIATDCLGIVLELNGLLAAIPLAYVLPAMCYLKLDEGHILSRKKLPALGVVLFGLVVTVLGIIFVAVDFKEVDTCSHGKIMPYCYPNNTLHNHTIVESTHEANTFVHTNIVHTTLSTIIGKVTEKTL
ncbi:putative sodium-coupled neutral amino acid transporter 11 isoform X2 [Agrilus planipennis]|uniref:Putative sodium-coupled neutral amino acid transporter 11 n=1 Tax=Agrilus planipennis TaxID=224129 RepID=A0A1W4W3G8_AGRPL|nr:putative sodium-coupled neutral amino acid transporter 11 isoform X2 [Agrilus planipennis]